MNFQLYVNEEKRESEEKGKQEERNRIIEEMRKSGLPEEQSRSIVFPKNETSQANA